MSSPIIVIPLRFTKDDILKHRKLTKIIPEMREFIDIISIRPLDPETLKSLDSEEVYNCFNIIS